MVIDYVPVEDVKFIEGHSIQDLKYNIDIYKVARGVNQKPSPRKPGLIIYQRIIYSKLKMKIHV